PRTVSVVGALGITSTGTGVTRTVAREGNPADKHSAKPANKTGILFMGHSFHVHIEGLMRVPFFPF
ncbi:MAG: hypothetical protein ABI147_03310, partial [Acidobacteriaceae bacterium]